MDLPWNRPWANRLLAFAVSHSGQSASQWRVSGAIYGGPEVVAGQRGEDLGGRQVMEIGMDFSSEWFAEVSGHDDARGEVGVAVEREVVVGEDAVGGQASGELRVVLLGEGPILERAGEGRIVGVVL